MFENFSANREQQHWPQFLVHHLASNGKLFCQRKIKSFVKIWIKLAASQLTNNWKCLFRTFFSSAMLIWHVLSRYKRWAGRISCPKQFVTHFHNFRWWEIPSEIDDNLTTIFREYFSCENHMALNYIQTHSLPSSAQAVDERNGEINWVVGLVDMFLFFLLSCHRLAFGEGFSRLWSITLAPRTRQHNLFSIYVFNYRPCINSNYKFMLIMSSC